MTTENEQGSLALKYRPKSLENIIGHQQAVTRLKGIVKSKKFPAAILFTGPPSVGKTTLARALSVAINGKLGPDVKEMNAADQRGIDDMRELIKLSKLRPMHGKKRIFIIDEFQNLMTNQVAAQAILKPVEEPSKDTLWIFCSMDTSKMNSSVTGRAILSRCQQFALDPHSDADMLKQALRIVKGEGMKYLLGKDEETKNDLLKKIVEYSNSEMRTLANIIAAAQQYYDGMDDPPKRLKKSDLNTVMNTVVSTDERLAVDVLKALYTCQFGKVQRALLDVENGVGFTMKLSYLSAFVLNATVLKGEKHKKVWWTKDNTEVFKAAEAVKLNLGQIAMVHDAIIQVKGQAMGIGVSAEELMSSAFYRCIKQLSATVKKD